MADMPPDHCKKYLSTIRLYCKPWTCKIYIQIQNYNGIIKQTTPITPSFYQNILAYTQNPACWFGRIVFFFKNDTLISAIYPMYPSGISTGENLFGAIVTQFQKNTSLPNSFTRIKCAQFANWIDFCLSVKIECNFVSDAINGLKSRVLVNECVDFSFERNERNVCFWDCAPIDRIASNRFSPVQIPSKRYTN